MGRYMRKAKLSGEVAVMEISHQTTLGVRTRARTLALQRLQNPSSSSSSSSSSSPASPESSLAYLELRSRRLEKPPPPAVKAKEACKESSGARPTSPKASSRSRTASSGSVRGCSNPATELEECPEIEVSFGENVLEIEAGERNVRETTPCSLIRDSDTISTPCSTTRTKSTATNRSTQNSTHRNIPTTLEMEEFFAAAEQLQQRTFMAKYNFDPVNELPLPGQYEWVKLDS
ncbi:cyclin-dependent kinase inhibitor 5-like [Typha angustifolia]|uniref:cyclin-dependent kinase inhibitor 5-like n=1 Tax=Typha angustifolia TaxID=59011 RepID=UPI003C2B7A64